MTSLVLQTCKDFRSEIVQHTRAADYPKSMKQLSTLGKTIEKLKSKSDREAKQIYSTFYRETSIEVFKIAMQQNDLKTCITQSQKFGSTKKAFRIFINSLVLTGDRDVIIQAKELCDKFHIASNTVQNAYLPHQAYHHQIMQNKLLFTLEEEGSGS